MSFLNKYLLWKINVMHVAQNNDIFKFWFLGTNIFTFFYMCKLNPLCTMPSTKCCTLNELHIISDKEVFFCVCVLHGITIFTYNLFVGCTSEHCYSFRVSSGNHCTWRHCITRVECILYYRGRCTVQWQSVQQHNLIQDLLYKRHCCTITKNLAIKT